MPEEKPTPKQVQQQVKQEVKKEVDKQVQQVEKQAEKQVKAEVKQEVKAKVEEQTQKIEQKLEEKYHKKLLQASKQTASFFGSEFKKQTATALMAAFGFLVALAWRDLITQLVNNTIPTHILDSYPYLDLLYTALVITIISAIAIALISRWAQGKENKEEKK